MSANFDVYEVPSHDDALDFAGTPEGLVEYWYSVKDLGPDRPVITLAGLRVRSAEPRGQHDGKPAVTVVLGTEGRDVGRLVVQDTSLTEEDALEWRAYFDSPETARENLVILKARQKRPPVSTVELDFAYEDEPLGVALATFSARYGISALVVDHHGPGGGWPVIEFSGLTENIEKMLRDGYDMTDSDIMEMLG